MVVDAAQAKKLDANFAVVRPALWEAWDIVHPRRPSLPQPTTWVVAPGGEVLWTRTTAPWSERTAAKKVLQHIADHRATGAVPVVAEVEAPTPEAAVDPPEALSVRAVRDGDWVTLHVAVAEGFHTYGVAAVDARPLEVWVDGTAVDAEVPAAAELRDPFEVRVRTEADAGLLSHQVCGGGVCSPPLQTALAVNGR